MSNLRSILIVDGSNFYFKLKGLNFSHPSHIDYPAFFSRITKDTKVIQKYYCIGKIQAKQQDKKAREMMANQQSFVTRLIKDGFTIQFGYLLKSKTSYHEKGVDVQMAVDIVKGAFKNTYDHAFLLSSDTDLIPAIVEAQAIGKTIEYIGFYHNPSYALLKTCKKSRLLTKDDLLPFYTP